MGDVNPQESERTPLKPREIAYAITRGNSCAKNRMKSYRIIEKGVQDNAEY